MPQAFRTFTFNVRSLSRALPLSGLKDYKMPPRPRRQVTHLLATPSVAGMIPNSASIVILMVFVSGIEGKVCFYYGSESPELDLLYLRH